MHTIRRYPILINNKQFLSSPRKSIMGRHVLVQEQKKNARNCSFVGGIKGEVKKWRLQFSWGGVKIKVCNFITNGKIDQIKRSEDVKSVKLIVNANFC